MTEESSPSDMRKTSRGKDREVKKVALNGFDWRMSFGKEEMRFYLGYVSEKTGY
jgi:hypothetical protein